MSRLYFLCASLPPLCLGEPPELRFEELLFRCTVNLSQRDLSRTVKLRQLIDLDNIRAVLAGAPLDPRGNLAEVQLDEALLLKESLPSCVWDFLDGFATAADKLRYFAGAVAMFLTDAIATTKGFLRKYFQWEREYRLVLLGLRAKEMGRDMMRELQFEDLRDPFVAQIVAQRDTASLEPPLEYLEVKELFSASRGDPWRRYTSLVAYKYRKVEEFARTRSFTLDELLSYMVRLLLVEDWAALDRARGNKARAANMDVKD